MSHFFGNIPIEHYKGRFTGTFDLEQDEIDATNPDQVLICVAVAHVKSAGDRVNTQAEGERTYAYGVTDMRIVTDGDLRQAIVESLGLLGADTMQLPLLPNEGFQPANGTAFIRKPPALTGMVEHHEHGDGDDQPWLDRDDMTEEEQRYPAWTEADPTGELPDEPVVETVGSIRDGVPRGAARPRDDETFRSFMEA